MAQFRLNPESYYINVTESMLRDGVIRGSISTEQLEDNASVQNGMTIEHLRKSFLTDGQLIDMICEGWE